METALQTASSSWRDRVADEWRMMNLIRIYDCEASKAKLNQRSLFAEIINDIFGSQRDPAMRVAHVFYDKRTHALLRNENAVMPRLMPYMVKARRAAMEEMGIPMISE